MEKQGIPSSSPPPPYAYSAGAQSPPQEGYNYPMNPSYGNEKVPLTAAPIPPEPMVQYAPPPHGVYSAQPLGYGQQPAVIYMQPAPLANPPQDHLGYSIFVTICCCWLIGIFAIINAAECRSAVSAGDRPKAEMKSRQAKKLANIALGLGIVSVVASFVIIGVYYGLLLSQVHSG